MRTRQLSNIYHLIVELKVLEAVDFGEGHPAWDVYLQIIRGDHRAAKRVRDGLVSGLSYKFVGATVDKTIDECVQTARGDCDAPRHGDAGDLVQIGEDFFMLTTTGYVPLEG